jgi:hypothetical protein
MSEQMLANAGDVLREFATSPESAAVFAVAMAVFTSQLKPAMPNPDLQKALQSAAELIDPLCPHCGKRVRNAPRT